MRIGFEAAHLTVSRHTWLVDALARHGSPNALVATEGVVEHARVRKDDYEIATLREAARRLSSVAGAGDRRRAARGRPSATSPWPSTRASGRPGSPSRRLRRLWPAAPTPPCRTRRPGERKLTEGDLVVLDFGGVYDSYCVDLTRTVSVGRASTRAREVYAAVLRGARPGDRSRGAGAIAFRHRRRGARRRSSAMAWARRSVTAPATGWESKCTRIRASRGAGRTSTRDDEAVAAGMVFTIEPGAYLPGWGGVRIEDDVLVTDDGRVDVLTRRHQPSSDRKI